MAKQKARKIVVLEDRQTWGFADNAETVVVPSWLPTEHIQAWLDQSAPAMQAGFEAPTTASSAGASTTPPAAPKAPPAKAG
jgi:hypothetical protein